MGTPIRVAHVATTDLTLRFLLRGQLRRLRAEGYEVLAVSRPGPWTKDLEAEGIRHIPWPSATRAWAPGADARAFAELVGILRAERPALVHTHNPKPGVLGRAAARLAGVPCVVNTVHGLYALPEDPPAKRFAVLGLERLAAHWSDLELYQSEEDLGWARRWGVVPRDKSALLGNGIDLEAFDPQAVPPSLRGRLRRDLGVPEHALVVGTVGRMVVEKGYRELFAAAAEVRRIMPEVRFLAVGGSDPERAGSISREEVERAGSFIGFAGWRTDVRDLLATMDVFVLASWREGVPRSAIEAAAMGKPMVLTDVRGCREVGAEGSALLVPPRDPAALASAIVSVLENAELRRRLGRAARARAIERFDERLVEEIVVEAYRRLLRSKGLAPSKGWGHHHPAVSIRPGVRADAPALAKLHRESLPLAFLPSLGDGVLTRLYRAMVDEDRSVVLVAENGNGVAGFAAGTTSVRSMYRRFWIRHGLRAALAAAPRLARPSVLRGALETARYPAVATGLPQAELLSIAVSPDARAKGVGRTLAEGVIHELGKRGAEEVKVVVDADNQQANRLYQRLGFRPAGRIELHQGRAALVWIMECRTAGHGSAS
jgi:glycosyltransferase involved in cell wall biosynthesis/ribosomal protein S18 acetylase RimI-like enzyme